MESQTTATPAPPRSNPKGYHALRVDSAGRLKLPARFTDYIEEYIRALNCRPVLFVTRFEDIVKIYLPGAWERELAKIALKRPELVKPFSEAAEYCGEEVDLDPQGRAVIPQKIRKTLPLEGQQVQVRLNNDTITVYRQETFDVRIAPSLAAFHETLASVADECGVLVD
jgi:DNA-binding transcriptional regulator/RsmH inhibitor MraZ